ncbi:MAG: chorismate mutase, partial [Clostridia bacterium]
MEISEIRSRIEPIDDELLKLFLERMDLIEEVTNYKRENHMPINDFAREREILTRITKDAGDREMYVHHFFTNLFQLSKARQREMISSPSNLRSIIEHDAATDSAVAMHQHTAAARQMASHVVCT